MRTPLTIQQLETAAIEAYEEIDQKTIQILTLSVQFRIRLCITRNGKYVGDALDESCRRAKVQLESTMTIRPFPANEDEMRRAFEEEHRESREPMMMSLPSFRNYQ